MPESGRLDADGEPKSTPDSGEVRSVRGVRRVGYMLLASVFFILGAAGALLPGLPATPFLLLTSYFLLRTSPRLNQRLLQSRLFGPILADWQQRGGVRRDVKLQAVCVVVLAVGATLWLSPLPAVWKWIVAALAGVGIVVVIRLPEIRERD